MGYLRGINKFILQILMISELKATISFLGLLLLSNSNFNRNVMSYKVYKAISGSFELCEPYDYAAYCEVYEDDVFFDDVIDAIDSSDLLCCLVLLFACGFFLITLYKFFGLILTILIICSILYFI